MRIMLMWPASGPEMTILFEELKKAGHEVLYWVGEKEAAHLAPKGAVFHDHYDAWDAKPAEPFAQEAFPPPSAELIASMHKTESLILTMMNKRYDKAPVDERKHTYYTMLGYWDAVLDRLKPDKIVFGLVPHSLYSNILYDLARERGIPTVCFEDSWVALHLLTYRDFFTGSEELRAALAEQQRGHATLEDLHPKTRNYYVEHARTRPGASPAYFRDQRLIAEGLGLLRHRATIALAAMREGTIFRLAKGYLARSLRKDLKNEYAELQRNPDLTSSFVYVPLPFQPERTTSPQGGIYHDQILMVETLAAALPKGWRVLVKEHPSQWWLRGKTRYSSARYRGYYERLAGIPNVDLIPIGTESAQLLQHARTVATATGTTGWDGILMGTPALVFGYPWYRDCPGALRVASVEDCREALSRVATGYRVDERDVLAFLKALDEVALRAHIADPPPGSPGIAPGENMRTLAGAVNAFLAERP